MLSTATSLGCGLLRDVQVMPLDAQVMKVLQQLAPKGCAYALRVELHPIIGQSGMCYAL